MTFEERVTTAFRNQSVQEMADALGVKYQTLHSWLKERSEPPIKRLRQISAITKVSLHWLLTGEGEMRVDKAPENPIASFVVNQNNSQNSNLKLVQGNNYEGDKVGRDKVVKKYYRNKIERVVNTPPPGSITEAQASQLKELLDDLGKKLTDRDGVNGYGNAHGAFKRRMKVSSYKNVLEEQFEEAKQYLQIRIKAVEGDLRKDGLPTDTREVILKRIYGKARLELKLTQSQVAEEARHYFGKPLSSCTIIELDRFDRYITDKVQKAKKSKK
jgi:transcriptional regulator with XRE-family HTH domain